MPETFGKLHRRLRRAAGLNLLDVAEHIKKTTPYISMIENDKTNPYGPDLVGTVASLFGVDPTELQRAAIAARGTVKLPAPTNSVVGYRLQAALARADADWTDVEYREAVERALAGDE